MSVKKLNVFILTNSDLTSNIIFSSLFESQKINVIGVAYTETITKNKGLLFGTFELLKKIDFFYWFYLVFTNGFFFLYEKLVLFFKPKNLNWVEPVRYKCLLRKIPVYSSNNFNSSNFLEILEDKKPDLLLIRINQILKQEILLIPKYGTWCIHSSLLPSYQGIAGEFHALLNNEPVIGSTIFEVQLKLDSGKTLNQCFTKTYPEKSLFHHMMLNNQKAANLLKDSIEQFCIKQKIENNITEDIKHSYYSWPKKIEVKEFRKNRKIIFTTEAFAYINKCISVFDIKKVKP